MALDTTAAPPRPWLVADIGGTNARFGWLGIGSDAVEHVATLPVAAVDGPVAAAQDYLARLQPQLGAAWRAPGAAAFAVATAVGGDEVAFTNSGWRFSRDAAQRALGLQTLLVLNDFEALALSLPRLSAQQLRPWPTAGATQGLAGAVRAVIGPGTGLGVAGLASAAHGFVALPGEGGHATLAAADDFESAVLAAVRHEHAHVSAERLLSGIGLPTLHRAIAAVLGRPAEPRLSAGDITRRGLSGDCDICSQTVDAFCALLGSFAGNVALVLGARGGVYIGGGIVPRFGERFFASRFRQRFEAKGRLAGYLQQIPTLLITDTLAALSGAAQALTQIQMPTDPAPAARATPQPAPQ